MSVSTISKGEPESLEVPFSKRRLEENRRMGMEIRHLVWMGPLLSLPNCFGLKSREICLNWLVIFF